TPNFQDFFSSNPGDSVKLFTCSVSMEAHYREFSGGRNRYFRQKRSFAAFHSKTPLYTLLLTNLSTEVICPEILRAPRKRFRYNSPRRNAPLFTGALPESVPDYPFIERKTFPYKE
ncbi:hypothetical protein, partial [Serratia sp. BIGb0163]|uniref:hypothetical protein n=1 Tax=Serratia sp. BIGb0163 TaxID=2940613 RepID=UPI0021679EC2